MKSISMRAIASVSLAWMATACGGDSGESAEADAVGATEQDAGASSFESEEAYPGEGAMDQDGGSSSYSGGTVGSAGAGSKMPSVDREPPLPDDSTSADAGADSAPDSGATAIEPVEPPRTNPFVATMHDPFSTFAADVDTASYDIFRQYVSRGILPSPESVRLEEYVNFFEYEYPAPASDSDVPFAISLEAAPHLMATGTKLLRVGIQGRAAPPFEKKPTNLVFLVDTSGSMSAPDKLPLVKLVLEHTLDILAPTDTVSIVTYAGSTRVALEPTPVSEKSLIASEIQSFEAGGSTNGAGGIELAYEQAQNAFLEGGINHVILCTDGDFNVGLSGTDELVTFIEEKRKTGITLTTLGFGMDNLNDEMMEAVADAGNGIYGVIASEEQANDYVENRMLATLVHIAKDVKIQVEFNPAMVFAYRLLGYEHRAIADHDFRNDKVDAGEIGSGHRVTAIYELALTKDVLPSPDGAPALDDGPPSADPTEVDPADLALVKVRYKHPGAMEADPAHEVATSLSPSAVFASHTGASPDFQWAIGIATFAEILKESPYANASALPTIQKIVTAQSTRDADRTELSELFSEARGLLGK